MDAHPTINPFDAARIGRVISRQAVERQPVRYARLPRAPINASPVPHLTSLYHNAEAGPYGDRRYPGNCSGYLIRDLLRFYEPATVYDPKLLAFRAGMRQCATDIIRFRHGASSSRKVYRSSFIPGLHDVCVIFEKTGAQGGDHE